ncbi:hypothetical protein HN51_006488 [Arachis hypogaea]
MEFDNTICMLVIYGDGNKTTFVWELFNKFQHQFEAASFLDEVSEKSRSADRLENLQNILLYEMGVHKKSKLGSTLKGSSHITQNNWIHWPEEAIGFGLRKLGLLWNEKSKWT